MTNINSFMLLHPSFYEQQQYAWAQRRTPENSQALAFAIFSELQLYRHNCQHKKYKQTLMRSEIIIK